MGKRTKQQNERKHQKDMIERTEKHAPTDDLKHRAGGPGKAARKGHLDPEHSGNAPGQKQSGIGGSDPDAHEKAQEQARRRGVR